MAHICPECGKLCTCNGDWDDVDFGEWDGCECQCWKGQEDDDEEDYYFNPTI